MIPDEKLVAALLRCGTATAAAADLGISLQTMYRRMATASFQEIYKPLQADLLRETVNTLAAVRNEAIDAVLVILHDETVNPATRLQAAQTVLANDAKYRSMLSDAEKEAEDMVFKKKAEEYTYSKLKEKAELEKNAWGR